MQENKNKNDYPKSFSVKRKVFSGFALRFLYFLNRILIFFSLKRTKNFWGIVYDSVTKQPLDPVIVKLLYTDGREIETCVTDLDGRYGFLAKPGKFKIYARKTNYNFPSLYAPEQTDGIYKNLYHGEFFTLYEDSEVLAPNIPMDPVGFDWNQQAKKKVVSSYPFLNLLATKLISVIFWFGLIICGLFVWRHYPAVPLYLYIILSVYFVLIALSRITRESRLWGRVIIKNSKLPAERVFLELHSARFSGISFGKAQVHQNGRFLLRAAKGKYVLSVHRIDDRKEKIFLGSMPVTIGRSGVLNASVEICERK